MADRKTQNVAGDQLKAPKKGRQPRNPAGFQKRSRNSTGNQKGVQRNCKECGAATRFVKGFVCCESDPQHNFRPVKLSCGQCKAPRSELVLYPGKVWCTKCAFTTVLNQVVKPKGKRTHKQKVPVKNDKNFPKLKQPEASPPKAEAKESPKAPKSKPRKPRSKQEKGTKAPTTPKTKPGKDGKPKVEWDSISEKTFEGVSSIVFTTKAKVNDRVKTAALQKQRCLGCNGAVSIGGAWSKVDFPIKNKTTQAEAIIMACPKNTCHYEYGVIVVSVKKDKAFKTAPVEGKGKPTITPQPRLDKNERPTELSESQVKEIFDEEVKRHSLKSIITEALRGANQAFREADSGARKILLETAREQVKKLSSQMPARLNYRRKTGPVRTIPLRWSVSRRTVLNPLWSVTLCLLSESETLSRDEMDLIQAAAFQSVILETQVPKKKRNRPAQQTPKTPPPSVGDPWSAAAVDPQWVAAAVEDQEEL